MERPPALAKSSVRLDFPERSARSLPDLSQRRVVVCRIVPGDLVRRAVRNAEPGGISEVEGRPSSRGASRPYIQPTTDSRGTRCETVEHGARPPLFDHALRQGKGNDTAAGRLQSRAPQ